MTLILIDLPDHYDVSRVTDFIETTYHHKVTAEIDPSVYVVDYGSVEHGPAVFVRRGDAEAFATDRTEASIERVTIADAATAALMVEDEGE